MMRALGRQGQARWSAPLLLLFLSRQQGRKKKEKKKRGSETAANWKWRGDLMTLQGYFGLSQRVKALAFQGWLPSRS